MLNWGDHMGYSDDDSMVRVDFFKPSGKWYETEAVKWTGEYNRPHLIHDAFKKSLRDHFADNPTRFSEFDAVCLEPYHECSHPIQVKAGGWLE